MTCRWLLTAAVFGLPAAAAPPAPPEPAPAILNLVPAAEPVPALKYRLLPELRDQHSGNAALLYYRAFSPEWQGFRRTANWSDAVATALESPPGRPPEQLAWV